MICTIAYAVAFGLILLISPLFLIPYGFLKLFGLRRVAESYIAWVVSRWAWGVLKLTGSRLLVSGLENLPRDRPVCFISNHQGNFDIPMILAGLRRKIGFIAKVELARVPLLSLWMRALHCVMIDRKRMHHSLRAIQRGLKAVLQGHDMLLFPEGTRSRSMRIGPFRPGGILAAVRAGIPIVPLTVNGSYRLFEEKGRIGKALLTIHVHPLIETSTLGEAEKTEMVRVLAEKIASRLPAETRAG